MGTTDGNGFVRCRCGEQHWGLFGAAGLALLRPAAPGGEVELLLQLRAAWTHQGGTWALPGGARDSHEDVVTAAVREACEEAGLSEDALSVIGVLTAIDHEDWSYTYVFARGHDQARPHAANAESDEVRWVPLTEVADLPLHAGFAHVWPVVREHLEAVVVAELSP